MAAIAPFIMSPELEAGESRILLDGVYRGHKLVDVNAINKG
jgi:hypothetical protein